MLKMSHIKLIKKDSNGTNSEEAVNNLSDLDISENDATSAFKLARKQSFKNKNCLDGLKMKINVDIKG